MVNQVVARRQAAEAGNGQPASKLRDMNEDGEINFDDTWLGSRMTGGGGPGLGASLQGARRTREEATAFVQEQGLPITQQNVQAAMSAPNTGPQSAPPADAPTPSKVDDISESEGPAKQPAGNSTSAGPDDGSRAGQSSTETRSKPEQVSDNVDGWIADVLRSATQLGPTGSELMDMVRTDGTSAAGTVGGPFASGPEATAPIAQPAVAQPVDTGPSSGVRVPPQTTAPSMDDVPISTDDIVRPSADTAVPFDSGVELPQPMGDAYPSGIEQTTDMPPMFTSGALVPVPGLTNAQTGDMYAIRDGVPILRYANGGEVQLDRPQFEQQTGMTLMDAYTAAQRVMAGRQGGV